MRSSAALPSTRAMPSSRRGFAIERPESRYRSPGLKPSMIVRDADSSFGLPPSNSLISSSSPARSSSAFPPAIQTRNFSRRSGRTGCSTTAAAGVGTDGGGGGGGATGFTTSTGFGGGGGATGFTTSIGFGGGGGGGGATCFTTSTGFGGGGGGATCFTT